MAQQAPPTGPKPIPPGHAPQAPLGTGRRARRQSRRRLPGAVGRVPRRPEADWRRVAEPAIGPEAFKGLAAGRQAKNRGAVQMPPDIRSSNPPAGFLSIRHLPAKAQSAPSFILADNGG